MMRRISSDLASFKNLTFRPGLNILLADKSEGATDRQSRNGAGKTSFVELVHFLCGSKAPKDSIFRTPALIDSEFEIVMDVGDDEYSVTRTGKKPSIVILNGPAESLPIQPKYIERDGHYEISNENWKSILGACWFDLDAPPNPDEKNTPTFRSLFSYFARRQGSGAFQTPVQHSGQQQLWDQQVAISYLLGLDWRIASDLQGLRGKEKIVKELGRAARSGDLGTFVGRAADIRTRLAVAERKIERLSSQLQTFQVIPEYRDLQGEANDITAQINSLGEENFIDRGLIGDLEASLVEEREPDLSDLGRLYEEAGVVLPDMIRRRFDEVEVFHRTIIENRRSHLTNEIASASRRIQQRERTQSDLDVRRRQIMEILQSGGALEQYTAMREELGRAEAEVENLRQRLTAAETLESSKAELEIERARIAQALRDDVHEREDIVNEAIVTFEELSEALYETAGSLTIDATANGPSFEVKIEGQRSKGITNMQIFCFDLMLLELSSRRGRSPGFLIHDSHLFDGVDERQVAKALQLGADRAAEHGYQYIVTMNSDVLPEDGYRPDFDVREYILDTKVTDATDTGGLFGLRF
ncbi:ABC-three component system protein [Rhodovulum marinum]|uniref:Uncharacterized protein YydD (DUF2326 family) n=1 Tax=Rhodovulum marinum TaxID=320662 RepID=A0A4R2PV42_9RHOB|nr:ABC-three component system protein [Rhodovulum marinum]TCP38061.1 uncharacterized protein YydD (DUF2326 family) [Rhodovulum marinum]